MIRTTRAQSWMIGKVLSYNLNAIVDSNIARGIIQVIHDNKIDKYSEEVNMRIIEFKKTSKKYKNPDAFLYGVVFSQFNCNGYVDAWYSQLFMKLLWFWFPDKVKNILNKYYKKVSGVCGLRIFNCEFIPRAEVRRALGNINKNSMLLTKILIKETGLNYKPKRIKNMKQDFLEGIEMTQNLNGKFNHSVADKIHRKVKQGMKEDIILDASKEFSYPDSFLKGAINSQLGASNWDFLFKILLKLFR